MNIAALLAQLLLEIIERIQRPARRHVVEDHRLQGFFHLRGLATCILAAYGDLKERQVIDQLAKLAPLERLGLPEDIANAVAFLASPDAAWINGQVLRVNGGII